MSTQKFLAKHSLIVATTLALSAIFGFLRESSIAYKFGATAATDAYLIAMVIPNLFVGLIKGSVTNTFVTVYSGYLASGRTDEGWRMTNVVLSLLGLVVAGLTVVLMLGTAGIVHLVAPGYSGQQLALAVELTRILLPGMLFGTLMGVLVGVNNANHSFLAPSLVGLVANVITITSIFILGSVWGIYGLAVGSLLGILAQFVIQVPSAHRYGLRYRFELDFGDPGLRETLRLVAPFVISAAASQVNLIVDRTLATGLPAGVVSALYFANKLVFLPQNIFTGAVGMVVFPLLTRAAAQRQWEDLIEGFRRSVRLLSLVLLPAALGIYVLRLPLVKLLFEHGAFTPQSTRITVETVGYFLGALYFGAMVSLVVNVYYALKKMAVAVGTGAVAVLLNIGFSLWFINPLAQRGLALANSLSALANLLMLTSGLYIVLPRLGVQERPLAGIGSFLVRVAVAVAGTSLVVAGYLRLVGPHVSGKSGLAFTVFSAVLLGVLVYGVLVYVLRIEEVRKGVTWLWRKARAVCGTSALR